MVCNVTVSALSAPGTHGLRQVGQPQSATVLRIAMCQRYLSPLHIFGTAQVDRPLKLVGVGGADSAFCAIHFYVGQAMMPDIEARDNRAGGFTGEIDYSGDMGRGVDGYLRASFG